MSKTKEEVINDLIKKRAEIYENLKVGFERLDPEKTGQSSRIHANHVKNASEKYYNFTKKIHQLESDYKDSKGSFLPEVYITHYEFYIAHNRSIEQLEQDAWEASLNVCSTDITQEYTDYWNSKKEIAERYIRLRNLNVIP